MMVFTREDLEAARDLGREEGRLNLEQAKDALQEVQRKLEVMQKRLQELEHNELKDEWAAYYRGMRDGISRFAVWQNGTQVVGSGARSLATALQEVDNEERNRG